jgi:hypothetical protein
MAMRDWIAKLDEFLRLSDRELLARAGSVSHEAAEATALAEYESYRAVEDTKPQPIDAPYEQALKMAKQVKQRAAPKRAG